MRVIILILDKTDFQSRNVTRGREERFVMIKVSVSGRHDDYKCARAPKSPDTRSKTRQKERLNTQAYVYR